MLKEVLQFVQRRFYAITCSLLFLAAVIVRILAVRGDFVMDEIWSLRLVTENVHRLTDIIFKIKHDNNHILNSIWIYILGPQQVWQLYRIPAVIGGSLCVLFSFLIARRQNRAQGIAALILTGFCFPLVFYSSEARGYGLMMGFIMIAFYAMQRLIEQSNSKISAGYVLLFWCAAALGFLSHLIFICAYMGLVAWSLVRIISLQSKSLSQRFKDFFLIHSMPIAILIFLHQVFVVDIVIGGAPTGSALSVLYQILIVTFGIWGLDQHVFIFYLAALILCGSTILLIKRFYGDVWIFFAVSILLAPLFLLIVYRFPFVSMRHFLPSILLFIFALSYLFGLLWVRTFALKVVALILFSLFIFGQTTYLPNFLKHGRGQFGNAVRYLYALSDGKPMKVSGDFDFRNALVFNFYKERINNAANLQYLPLSLAQEERNLPDIFLIHFFRCAPWDIGCLPHDVHEDTKITLSLSGRQYQFSYLKSFPWHGILSGWSWIMFRREDTVFPGEAIYSNE